MEKAVRVLVLAGLYVVAVTLPEFLGFIHPFGWTYSAVFAAVLAAWPYFMLCKRHPMPGMAILCAMLLLMVHFLFNQGHEYFAMGCIVLGCVAEGLRKLFGNYRGRKGVIASYAALSLIPFSKSIVMWIDYETAMGMVISRMGDIYVAVMGRMLSKYMLLAMIILTLVLAIVTMTLLTANWRPRDQYHVVE